jgi:predicted MPP superfamily phosphohydrolase
MVSWICSVWGQIHVNWGWLLLRIAIGLGILTLLFLSQRFWYRALWRISANWGNTAIRVSIRSVYVLALILVIFATADGMRMSKGHLLPRASSITVVAGLWFFSALFAYLAVLSVRAIDRLWSLLRPKSRNTLSHANQARTAAPVVGKSAAAAEFVRDPSRRYFFQSATAAAGAAPFLCAAYGFASERLRYTIHRVEIPVANLTPALDGMKIVQISDIHMSGYMPREEVRRAVDMANDLGADLAVVTGDFITGAGDPLADCIDEIRQLRAPLGVWGCNGNHEIYARAEETSQALFAQAGMKLLRQENVQLHFKGAPFNLIGVDYQRERTPRGQKVQALAHLQPLVRRDMPNILLSHNPNSFNRAAELGIELSLAGHTHGGQIQVEILDHRLSPAHFFTDYIAGLYQRPLFASSQALVTKPLLPASILQRPSACLYVNRGLGTVGAPVRLGVPPEITLLTLRRA